ncbi:hypothetical protein ACE6H2_000816 [Prunus campanulata]
MVPDQSQRLLGRYLMILADPEPKELEKKIIVEASSPRASLKSLYDDESLFSPTSRIIPIPEADDQWRIQKFFRRGAIFKRLKIRKGLKQGYGFKS